MEKQGCAHDEDSKGLNVELKILSKEPMPYGKSYEGKGLIEKQKETVIIVVIFVIVVAHNLLLLLVTALDLTSVCVRMGGSVGALLLLWKVVSWDCQPRCSALYTKKRLSVSLSSLPLLKRKTKR